MIPRPPHLFNKKRRWDFIKAMRHRAATMAPEDFVDEVVEVILHELEDAYKYIAALRGRQEGSSSQSEMKRIRVQQGLPMYPEGEEK